MFNEVGHGLTVNVLNHCDYGLTATKVQSFRQL